MDIGTSLEVAAQRGFRHKNRRFLVSSFGGLQGLQLLDATVQLIKAILQALEPEFQILFQIVTLYPVVIDGFTLRLEFF